MRSVPFDLVIYDDEDTDAARDGRAMSRRSGAVTMSDEPALGSHRSLAWLSGLARRRPAARARRAAA